MPQNARLRARYDQVVWTKCPANRSRRFRCSKTGGLRLPCWWRGNPVLKKLIPLGIHFLSQQCERDDGSPVEHQAFAARIVPMLQCAARLRMPDADPAELCFHIYHDQAGRRSKRAHPILRPRRESGRGRRAQSNTRGRGQRLRTTRSKPRNRSQTSLSTRWLLLSARADWSTRGSSTAATSRRFRKPPNPTRQPVTGPSEGRTCVVDWLVRSNIGVSRG